MRFYIKRLNLVTVCLLTCNVLLIGCNTLNANATLDNTITIEETNHHIDRALSEINSKSNDNYDDIER